MEIEITDQATNDWIALQEAVQWGTSGVQYQVHHLEEGLKGFKNPRFVSFREQGLLVGGMLFTEKRFSLKGQEIPAFYLGMIAINPTFQGKGIGMQLTSMVKNHLLQKIREERKGKGILYAFVENKNERSLNILHKSGYRVLGQFRARIFGRTFTRKDPRVFLARPEQKVELASLLSKQYADHALVDFSTLFNFGGQDHPLKYFLLMEKGKILAGASIFPQTWTFTHIPGIEGILATHILPHIPILKRLFNPHYHHFLRIGHIYIRPNYEKEFFQLMTALIHREGTHSAILEFDEQCPVYQRMNSQGKFGLLDSLNHTKVSIMGFFEGFSEEERLGFCNRPFHIGIHDI